MINNVNSRKLVINLLIAIAAYYDYEIWQMDVKTAFLNGRLDEDIYMEQPEGYVDPKFPNGVCKLQRAIYGLKQASRQWNKRFDEEIKRFGFIQNRDEPCVYRKASGSDVVFLILYVDDILIMGNNIPKLKEVKDYLGKCFSVKDLGEAAYILGIKIYRDRSLRLIGLNQSAYIDKILKKFNMQNSKKGFIPMEVKHDLSNEMCASSDEEKAYMKRVPYASAVGSIMYAVRCTRPDVAFAQNLVSRYQQNPGKLHWVAVKHILKYLRNTKDMFLVYGGNPDTELDVTGFCDASWQCDKDDTKSQTGYVFVVNGGAVDWKSKKQTTIAMHATQSEYMAASEAAMEAVWIRKFVEDLGVMPSISKPINMYCDNSAAIIFANEPGVMKGARHFLRRYHYVREQVESGEIKLIKVHTDKNLADAFTKALPRGKVSEHANGIGLRLASSFMHICDYWAPRGIGKMYVWPHPRFSGIRSEDLVNGNTVFVDSDFKEMHDKHSWDQQNAMADTDDYNLNTDNVVTTSLDSYMQLPIQPRQQLPIQQQQQQPQQVSPTTSHSGLVAGPQVKLSAEDLERMMGDPHNIRNVSVIGHFGHGKSTLMYSLVASAGLIAPDDVTGDTGMPDTDHREAERVVTTKLSGQYVHYEMNEAAGKRGENCVVDDTNAVLRDAMVSPVEGTVAFSSVLYGWAFTLTTFSEMYGYNELKLRNRLWGDNYYDRKKRKWTNYDTGAASCEHGFVQFCYLPIKSIMKACLNNQKDSLWPLLKKYKVELKDEEKEFTGEKLMKCVMQNWLSAATALLEMSILHLPSPYKAQVDRVANLYQGPIDDPYANGVESCNSHAPLLLYVCKMMPAHVKDDFFCLWACVFWNG
ncbi:retrotransposon protein, putative, ty1-copia subclass [Tanacetum coccineum]